MSSLTRDFKHARRHLVREDGKPLCGGGHGGRTAQYKVDIGDDVNCAACLKIMNGGGTR